MSLPYHPILRFKRGEQTALSKAPPSERSEVRPLLNIQGHAFEPDSDTGHDPVFQQRLAQEAVRLNSSWGGSIADIDLSNIDPDARCGGGVHPLTYLFDEIARAHNPIEAHPVVRLSSDRAFVDAVADICSRYNRTPTFRLFIDDLQDPDLAAFISHVTSQCGREISATIAIMDLQYIASLATTRLIAYGAVNMMPFRDDWRYIVLAGGSFPSNLSGFAPGKHVVPRLEWFTWRATRTIRPHKIAYGDYATIHPLPVEEALDPAVINPTASVRYTFNDSWILFRGQGVKTSGSGGFTQFQGHADQIVAIPEYRGHLFSFGDLRIWNIHRRNENAGNLETWVTIGVNHHIKEIIDRLASLSFP